MGASERVSCKLMVEFFFGKSDDLEIHPVVITMTFNTFFPFDLDRSMKTFVQIDPRFQFGMTFKAFLIGYLLPKDMTFGTIRDPLQVGMHPGKLPGRDLGNSNPYSQKSQ
jgi:hypothetical protein